MNEYATLAQIRAYLTASDTAMATADDDKLFQYLTWASRLIEQPAYAHRKFYPRQETRYYDYQSSARDHWLDDDLLELTTLTVDGTTISSDDYYLYPHNETPKYRISMDYGGGEIFTFSSTPQKAISILGIWGYHDDWSNAWVDSQDTVQNETEISASGTSLTVSDADGSDINGLTPRFSAGQLLKIESEYLAVTATDTSGNTLTVRRGVNGTTAAAHANGTTINVFKPFAPAVTAVLDLAKWIYEHRDERGGIIALPSLEGTAIKTQVDDILAQHALPKRAPSFKGMTRRSIL